MMIKKALKRHSTAFLLPPVLLIFLTNSYAVDLAGSPDDPLRRSTPADQQTPYSEIAIGVLDLDGRNLDEGTVLLVSDRLRYHVSENPIFLLIERSKIRQITEEQGFQLSGASATDESIVQVGNIIGVRKMMAGSIGKAGSLYTLQIRIFDVETSRVEFQEYQNADSIENLLEYATSTVVNEIGQEISIAYNLTQQSADTKFISQPAIRTFAADLRPLGVDDDEVDQISDRLRVYLGRTGTFQAISEEEMLTTIVGQDYQIPATIETAEQAVNLGKNLGVSKVVYGKVARVRREYTIKIKIIDVETSQLENLLVMYSDGFGDVLTEGPRKVAAELAKPYLPPDL